MKKIRGKKLSSIIVFSLALFMGFHIVGELFSSVSLNLEIRNARKENSDLSKETEKLQNEVSKLNDKEYIQSYVSGTMFSTKEGTTVYILPEDEKGKNAPE